MAYTAGLAGAILLLIFMIKWNIPVHTPPVVAEYIEINLGNSDVGSGNDQPQLPGDPAPAQQTAYVPPQPVQSATESAKDIDENETAHDAPPVVKPAISKPDATRINTESKSVRKTTTTVPQPVTPAPPRPKAVLGHTVGGTGNGGNGADTYKPGTGEGQGGGPGDQGVIGGNPNGTRYTGTPRNLGVRVVNIGGQTFSDDFNKSGKIVLDIVVDANGRLVSASYQPSGSTLPKSSSNYQIALDRARTDVKYPKYEGGFRQSLTFNFKVN